MSEDRCSCGGIILADTESWSKVMCHTCFCRTDWYLENKKLQKTIDVLRESNSYYLPESGNWRKGKNDGRVSVPSTDKVYHDGEFCGGKKARQAELKVKEILGE